MSRLEEHLFEILAGSRTDLSTAQLTQRNKITIHQERVANAMRTLEEQGKVSFTGDGRWHHKRVIHFNGKDFMVGEFE